MTFSIAAFDQESGEVAVGAVTAMPAVGKLVTHARAGVGAACTQATLNPYLAIDALDGLADGKLAKAALDDVIIDDPGKDVRQCGVVDTHGGSHAWTGADTPEWSGHRVAPCVTAQGNRLVGPETLDAVVAAFEAAEGQVLARRILAALEAGEATGADRHGAVSATLTVFSTEDYPLWDVRVDHADAPVARLRELVDEFEEALLPIVRALPTRADPLGDAARHEGESLA